jgi:thiamine pyrophosphate-dependent acetolactate synthase large subunit-like protein
MSTALLRPFETALRFDLLAQSMGVQAVRVERANDIGPAIEKNAFDDKPFLIDLVLGAMSDRNDRRQMRTIKASG